MIIITIRIKIFPNKFKELCQTLHALRDLMRKEKGFLASYIYKDIDNDNIFCLMQEWKTRDDLEAYLNSENFGVLLGAIHLLAESPHFKISTVLSANETEVPLEF